MSDEGGKIGAKHCPYGFGRGGNSGGDGCCPAGYGTGSSSHFGSHGHHGGGAYHQCPFLMKSHGHGDGTGFGGYCGFGGHGSSYHGADGSSPMAQCPWVVARMHACPWAWGAGSGHHAHQGGCRKQVQKGDFSVTLKVVEYCPGELEVKVVDKEVIVHGKHDARPDHPGESGSVSREFTRRYPLGDDIDPDTVASSINADKELTITAQKKVAEGEPRVIDIEVAGDDQ